MTKTYRGHAIMSQNEGGPQVVTVTTEDGASRQLKHRVRHSPDGFQWGYGGSGPADLARSILWDHLGREPEPAMYQEFKGQIVAAWPSGENWTITSAELDSWLYEYERPGFMRG